MEDDVIRRSAWLLGVFALMALAFGCSGGGESAGPRPAVAAENAFAVRGPALAGNDALAARRVGDILYTTADAISDAAPFPFARRIESVDVTGDAITFGTSRASLNDVFDEIDYDSDRDGAGLGPAAGNAQGAVSPRDYPPSGGNPITASEPDGLTVPILNDQLVKIPPRAPPHFPRGGVHTTLGKFPLQINRGGPSIEIGAMTDFGLDWKIEAPRSVAKKKGKGDRFLFKVGFAGDIDTHATLNLDLKAGLHTETEWIIYPRPHEKTPGEGAVGTPLENQSYILVLGDVIALVAYHVGLRCQFDLKTDVSVGLELSAHAHLEPLVWWDGSLHASIDPATFTVTPKVSGKGGEELQVTCDIAPQIAFLTYDLVGPYLRAGLLLKAGPEFLVGRDGDGKFAYDVNAVHGELGFGVWAGGALTLFGLKEWDAEFQLVDVPIVPFCIGWLHPPGQSTGSAGVDGKNGEAQGPDPTAVACENLVNGVSSAQQQDVRGDPPPPRGGTPVPGFYRILRDFIYTGAGGEEGLTGVETRASLRVSSVAGKTAVVSWVEEATEAGNPQNVLSRSSATVKLSPSSGSEGALAYVCPDNGAITSPYSFYYAGGVYYFDYYDGNRVRTFTIR